MVAVAEVAIAVAVVGYFVSPHITRLMEIARSRADNSNYKLSWCMKKKLKKLARDLEDINDFLYPARMEFVNDGTWLGRLWRLKDAIHDAEEILDLFESHILELEAAKKLKKRRGGASSSSGRKPTGSPSLDQLNKVLKNLGDIREKARELSQNPDTRRAVLSPISGRSAGMGQDPVRDRKLFFGYDNEYEELVSMLRDGSTEKTVIAIIGHGGMGKTELARQAFRDVKGEFRQRLWVPAYGKKTESDVLKEIWKSAAGAKSVDQMNIGSLMMELKELLSPNKCLLVLDDVWNDECATSELERQQAWKAVCSLLGDGSKIVMTTRAKICSTTLCANASIVLNGIKPKDITLLLNDTAMLKSDGSQRRIQELLNNQVLKFKGSPLAAVEIGLELKTQTTSRDRCSILNNIDHHIVSVFKGHLFTYHHLPPHLQRCLSFCSIFPYNWRFHPMKLTKMWIALGFVEDNANPAVEMSSMEDISKGYFNSLVDRSLFQLEEASSSSSSSMGEGDKHYVIHEQIHWMLRLASAKNCIRISGATGHGAARNIPATVRHLSVTSGCLDQLKKYSIRLCNLRTLLVINEDDDDNDPAPLISYLLDQFKGVRVLDLMGTGITQLPENIGKLKHVRYLGLPDTISSDLGDQVTKLLFLQTLTVGEISNTDKKNECITNISGIGRLVKLRESIEFQVMRGSEKQGHSVSELAGMNSLGETLTINGLEAIASKEEAEEAQLGRKFSVKTLKLEWSGLKLQQFDDGPSPGSSAADAPDPAVAVLEGLQPHGYLHELRITRYPGETSPTWLSGLEKLTRLYLKNCRKLKALPALGGLPCLELLDIKELTVVERIDAGFCGRNGLFPKLKKIVLDDMEKLVAWDDMPKGAFPLLREVNIDDCPQLSSLSGLGGCEGPLNLHIKGCPAITKATLPENFTAGNSTYKFY